MEFQRWFSSSLLPLPKPGLEKVECEVSMHRTTVFRIWHALITSIAVIVLGGCSPLIQSVTPSPQPLTVMPPYIHYVPSEGFDVRLEFDYPSSWVFSESQIAHLIDIELGDPRFRTLPPPPEESHRVPNDFGKIFIMIVPGKPGQTPDTELEGRKQLYSQLSRITLLNDYEITIDGYYATVLEYQLNDPENFTSLMFVRRIFLAIDDQFYEIFYTVAEKDRGGDFEQGYEYFFKSLEIVP
jgi:hypothetical protein